MYCEFAESKAKYAKLIEADSDKYADAVWTLIQANPERYLGGELDGNEVINEIKERTKQQFDEYVDTVYSAHRSVRHGFEEVKEFYIFLMIFFVKNSPTWNFKNSLFFTATMLTSIGYGFLCPSTFEGRLFGLLYCLIGIPLTLVNVAKYF